MMKKMLKSLTVGLCAALVVIGVGVPAMAASPARAGCSHRGCVVGENCPGGGTCSFANSFRPGRGKQAAQSTAVSSDAGQAKAVDTKTETKVEAKAAVKAPLCNVENCPLGADCPGDCEYAGNGPQDGTGKHYGAGKNNNGGQGNGSGQGNGNGYGQGMGNGRGCGNSGGGVNYGGRGRR